MPADYSAKIKAQNERELAELKEHIERLGEKNVGTQSLEFATNL